MSAEEREKEEDLGTQLAALAEHVESDEFTLPPEAVVVAGVGDQPGRAILLEYMTAEELDEFVSRKPASD